MQGTIHISIDAQGREEGPEQSVSALSFTTNFNPQIASSGGGRVEKWLKIASIDMWTVPYAECSY